MLKCQLLKLKKSQPLSVTFEVQQYVAAVIVRFREVRLQRQRAVAGGHCFVVAPEFEQHGPAVGVSLRVAGLQAECLIVAREGICMPPQFRQHIAQMQLGITMSGIHLHRAREQAQRCLQLPALRLAYSEIVQRLKLLVRGVQDQLPQALRLFAVAVRVVKRDRASQRFR